MGRLFELKSLASLSLTLPSTAPTRPPDDAFDPTGILDEYVSYLVCVNMTNPPMSGAVFSDTSVLPQEGPWASTRNVNLESHR